MFKQLVAPQVLVAKVQYIALFMASRRWRGWWTGLVGELKWRGVDVYLLGSSL